MLLIPVALAVLITLHLAIIMRQHHSQFPGPGRRERNVVGTPMWPAYALRSIGLLLAVAGVLFLLGGLVQINPIWQWGPYHPYLSENGAQPDWYIGWLIGALRPDAQLGARDRRPHGDPQPVLGRRGVPAVRVRRACSPGRRVERRVTGDIRRHDLLDRPRDRPIRTAIGAAFLTWVVIVFAVGSTDRIFYRLGVSYTAQIHVLAGRRLGAADPDLPRHPQRLPGAPAQRRPPATGMAGQRGAGAGLDGSVTVISDSPDRAQPPMTEPPVGTVPGREFED